MSNTSPLVLVVLLPIFCGAQITNLDVPHKRYLHDSQWGQLHYAASSNFSSAPTLLLFHANPDSLIAFRELLNTPQLRGTGRFNFIAFDYFGMGSSDDCVPPACVDPSVDPSPSAHSFVTIPEFMGLVQEIVTLRTRAPGLDALGLGEAQRHLVCMGVLKGSQMAIECARRFGAQVLGLLAVAPVWFDVAAVQRVRAYTLHTRKVPYTPTGQQYIDAWHQPSVCPGDRVNGSYCQTWTPRAMELNHLKTLNRARAFQTQWQLLLAGLDRNADIVDRALISTISAPHVHICWPEVALAMYAADGFQPSILVPHVNEAWKNATGGRAVVEYVANASEGTMYQNASYYATRLLGMISS